MSRDVPSTPWTLRCPWCEHAIEVNGRGMRGRDMGAGVEAAELMRHHVEIRHGRTWPEFLEARP